MWTASILREESTHLSYFLRGPRIIVGRNADIPFTEKSISRQHAEVKILPDGSLVLTDLGSKFGTFIIGDEEVSKLTPSEEYPVSSGEKIKFGIKDSIVIFKKEILSFCQTRISKAEKIQLREQVKIIGGCFVEHAEDATHIVSSRIAATMKMLTAIAVNKCIVTPAWLNFCATDNVIEMIPSTSE